MYGELETLVLGKRIFLDCDISNFEIYCCSFATPLKNSWPSDFDVSFEEAKMAMVLDPSVPLPSYLGPKDVSSELLLILSLLPCSIVLVLTPFSLFGTLS